MMMCNHALIITSPGNLSDFRQCSDCSFLTFPFYPICFDHIQSKLSVDRRGKLVTGMRLVDWMVGELDVVTEAEKLLFRVGNCVGYQKR